MKYRTLFSALLGGVFGSICAKAYPPPTWFGLVPLALLIVLLGGYGHSVEKNK